MQTEAKITQVGCDQIQIEINSRSWDSPQVFMLISEQFKGELPPPGWTPKLPIISESKTTFGGVLDGQFHPYPYDDANKDLCEKWTADADRVVQEIRYAKDCAQVSRRARIYSQTTIGFPDTPKGGGASDRLWIMPFAGQRHGLKDQDHPEQELIPLANIELFRAYHYATSTLSRSLCTNPYTLVCRNAEERKSEQKQLVGRMLASLRKIAPEPTMSHLRKDKWPKRVPLSPEEIAYEQQASATTMGTWADKKMVLDLQRQAQRFFMKELRIENQDIKLSFEKTLKTLQSGIAAGLGDFSEAERTHLIDRLSKVLLVTAIDFSALETLHARGPEAKFAGSSDAVPDAVSAQLRLNCGLYGERANVIHIAKPEFFSRLGIKGGHSVIMVCPGFLAGFNRPSKIKIRERLAITIGHELGHILGLLVPKQYEPLRACAAGLQSQLLPGAPQSHLTTIDKDESERIAKILGLRSPDELSDTDTFVDEMLADRWASRVANLILRSYPEIGEREELIRSSLEPFCVMPEGDGVHPPNRFRIESFMANPDIREALRCYDSSPLEKLSCG